MARPTKKERKESLTTNLRPIALKAVRLFARHHNWSDSMAAAILIEKGLASEGIELPKAA